MDYGETSDVQEVHAAIQREKREPRVGLEPLSIWLIAVYGLAIFTGGAYLGRYSGTFSGDGLDPMGGRLPRKKAADRKDNNSRPSFRRVTAAKRFSRPTVKRVIKPTVLVFPGNIRRWPVRNSPLAGRSDRP